MDQALENALQTARIAAGAKQIELVAPRARGGWVVIGNPERLQQIFSNLLSNAVKFTPRGGRVEVRAETVGRRGAHQRDRQRRRHRARAAAAYLRSLPPGRQLVAAAPRRPGTGARHRALARGAARRPGDGRKRGRGAGARRSPSRCRSRPSRRVRQPLRAAIPRPANRCAACACSRWTTRRTRSA